LNPYAVQYPSQGYPDEPLSLSNGHNGEYIEEPQGHRDPYIEETVTPSHSWSQDVDMITIRAGAPAHPGASMMPQFDHMQAEFPNIGTAPPAQPEAGPSSLPPSVPIKKTPRVRLPPKKTTKTRRVEVRPSPERPGAGPRAPRNTHCDTCHRVNVINEDGNRDTMLSCWTCGRSGQLFISSMLS
jgi:hypothetical protein